ncbi:MAG: hypothetical protein ACLQJF_16220 [Candidatus Sulfotelmatobacter sp.]
MSDKTKSVHCVREVRDATIERFRLPDDGRQWKTAARNRQALANYLATFADGDGTRVRPSEPTMTEHFGWSRATTFRYLDDLKALGLQKRVGRFGGSRGVAIRELDVALFRVGVANSPSESQSQTASESQTQASESQTQASESHHACDPTVLVLPPPEPPPPPPSKIGGGLSLSEKYPTIAYGKHKELDGLIKEHGNDLVDKALADVAQGDFTGVRNIPAAVFSTRLPARLAELKVAAAAAQKEAEYQKWFIEVEVPRQTAELMAARFRGSQEWQAAHPERIIREESVDDFLKADEM